MKKLIVLGALGTLLGSMMPSSASAASAYITDVAVLDAGGGESTGSGVDILQGVCGTAPSLTAEPFYDSILKIDVVNNGLTDVRFESFSYTISRADLRGIAYRSRRLSLSSSAIVASRGGTAQLRGLFFDVQGTRKAVAGTKKLLPLDTGFRNVTVKLFGRTSSGRSIIADVEFAVSFDNFDRC